VRVRHVSYYCVSVQRKICKSTLMHRWNHTKTRIRIRIRKNTRGQKKGGKNPQNTHWVWNNNEVNDRSFLTRILLMCRPACNMHSMSYLYRPSTMAGLCRRSNVGRLSPACDTLYHHAAKWPTSKKGRFVRRRSLWAIQDGLEPSIFCSGGRRLIH
jgi:hypothetical protein